MSDPRFVKGSGLEAFTGNELLLKGGLESGMALLTGYPGSPVSDIFDSIFANRELLKEHGVLGQMANNEALAAARLNGARMANLRAVAVMKSVGMHVAADGLAIGNLTEPNHPQGGCLVVVGDDPWNETTQINSDSRFLAQHLQMPILEPSTFQEIKDWMDLGFELSGKSNLYVAYLITTNQADGGGSVEVRSNRYPAVNFNSKIELSSSELPIKDFVMIPPHTSQKEATMKARYEKFLALARGMNLNEILYGGGRQGEKPGLGFITCGTSYCYLEHALYEMGLAGLFPILKMGATHPLDKSIVLNFLKGMKMAVVVEEKRPFLENQVKSCLQEYRQEFREDAETQIFGKSFPFGLPGIPEVRGLNASLLIERLAPLILKLGTPEIKSKRVRIESELALLQENSSYKISIPLRTPTFCPGCPHRDSATVSLKIKKEFSDPDVMRKEFGREPVDVIFHGESGCHSMLQFAPNEGLMQNYSGMGLGGGTGAGIDPFIKNKQVVFVGDSTFFHSAMIAVSDSIKNHQDITYVILDNKTTAMTGHQPTPGNDFDVLGRKTLAQNIEKVIRGISGGETVPVVRANPEYRESYTRLLQDLILKDGVKVVIADKECGITYQRRAKKEKKEILLKQGFLEKEEFINITPDVCEYCLECTRSTGCPGLTVEETDFGPKIVTDLSTCVSDSACTKGKVCPSFEKVIVTRDKPPLARRREIETSFIPLPTDCPFDETYYISTFAVGGMGAGVVSAILVRAGLKEGYRVLFLDKKGLAIRNGGVYGHILYSRNKTQVFAPLVPYGKADLILGIDILETARGLDPKVNIRAASPARTSAIVNTHKTPTVLTLMGQDDFDPDSLSLAIRSYTKAEKFFGLDFSEISQSCFGSKLYANLLLVGAAFQKGLIPCSLANLEAAIGETVSSQDLKENLKALRLGREIAFHPEKFPAYFHKGELSYDELLNEKTEILKQRKMGGEKQARQYRNMVENAIRWMHLDESTNKKIALRIYELIQYENAALAEQYLSLIWDVYRKDRKNMNYEATKRVIENLFKVMAIKDEVYVAHLLTSREKLVRDLKRYEVNFSNGDRIHYIHLNRPEFAVFGLKIAFDVSTRNWMLNIMKHCKFLRRILPEWHAREKEFRDWYVDLVRKFNFFQDDLVYRKYAEILKTPEPVRGYRKIRYPKMEDARNKADHLLSEIRAMGNPENIPGGVSVPSASPETLS